MKSPDALKGVRFYFTERRVARTLSDRWEPLREAQMAFLPWAEPPTESNKPTP
jgi:hypothetical protein